MKYQQYWRIYLLGIFSFFYLNSFAQKNCAWNSKYSEQMVKINLLNLPFKTFNLGYERTFRDNITLGGSVVYTPKRDIPFKETLLNRIDDNNAKRTIDEASLSQFSIIPEIRFYFGNQDAFTRFYAAPYIKYTRYTGNFSLFYNYVSNTGTTPVEIPVNAHINSISLGYSLGLQFNIIDNFFLDWKIIGNHYGYLFGKSEGTPELPLSENIQDDIRQSIETINDIPIYSFDHNISSNYVEIKPKGLNIGFTTTLSIGYKF